jgi:dihydroneopterin aldolase
LLKVNINELTFDCIIGILDEERVTPQRVIIDISFEYYFDEDGSNFIDYSKVAEYVQSTMIEEKFELIEDAILYLRKGLKSQYDMKNLWIKIAKPDILGNAVVSVEE